MVILVVFLQMFGQFVYFSAKQGNLDVWRTSVRVVPSRILNDGRLYALGKHDSRTLPHLAKERKYCVVRYIRFTRLNDYQVETALVLYGVVFYVRTARSLVLLPENEPSETLSFNRLSLHEAEVVPLVVKDVVDLIVFRSPRIKFTGRS